MSNRWLRGGRRAAALLLACVLLAGCWDRREIEDMGFVLLMGLDQASEPAKIVLTVQIAVPRTLGGQEGVQGAPDTPPAAVERLEGNTVSEVVRNLETFVSRRVSFLHLKAIVIGRELAEDGIQEHIDILTRMREFRRTVMILVAERTAAEVLTYRPELEKEPALAVEDLTRRAYESTARAPRVNLHRFLTHYAPLGSSAHAPIVTARSPDPAMPGFPAGTKARLSGTAVFRGDKMVGTLSPKETETMLMLQGRTSVFHEDIRSPDSPDWQVAVRLQVADRNVRVTPTWPIPTIDLHLKAEGEIREIEKLNDAVLIPDTLREIEARLNRGLEEKAADLIKKLQEELRSDVVGFGNYVKMRFLDVPSWERYEWGERIFPKAKIRVTVETKIRRVGTIMQTGSPGD